MDRQTERFIINNFMNMKALLNYVGVDVAPNDTMFCPFHPNTNTKAAHYYPDDEHGPCIFCYAEHRLYTNYDIYKILIPDVNTTELAQALYDRLSQDQKDWVESNVNSERELPEVPYIESLRKFKKGEIDYQQLLWSINLALPKNESTEVMETIYNLPTINMQGLSNKYVYFMNTRETQYKILSSRQALQYSNMMPEFLIKYFQRNGDCICIPNKINDIIYSLTFRTLGDRKQFLKYGDVTHLLYNLGNLPKDFHYGIPLVLCEGNLDCDALKEIYPYTVASLTSDLSTNQIQILTHLTDKVIVAYDNDESGQRGFYSLRKKLKDTTIIKFEHFLGLHDAGDLIEKQMKDPDEYNYIKRSYTRQIERNII